MCTLLPFTRSQSHRPLRSQLAAIGWYFLESQSPTMALLTLFVRLPMPESTLATQPTPPKSKLSHSTLHQDVGSTKIDVYSFGVFLTEMCLHQPPKTTHEGRIEQFKMVAWDDLTSIIDLCTDSSPDQRPSLTRVMESLGQHEDFSYLGRVEKDLCPLGINLRVDSM